MIEILIRTGPQLSTFGVEQGAVLNIIPLSDGATSKRNILIASGDIATTQTVAPGRYLFQVDLPSGEMVSKEMQLQSNQSQPVNLELFSKQSPHEWLSWQQINADLTQTAKRRPVTDRLMHYAADGRMGAEAEYDEVRVATQKFKFDTGTDYLEHFAPIVEFIKTGITPASISDAPLNLSQMNQDGQFFLFGWFQHGADYLHLENRLDRPEGILEFDRYYVAVEHDTGLRELMALPFPWRCYDAQCPLELLVPRHPDLNGPRARLTVMDGEFGTMLTYLSRGSISGAQPFANTLLDAVGPDDGLDRDAAIQSLYFKRSNPLAAAGAGYVLVQTAANFGAGEKWHKWIENLCNWFPWLADGAVLLAVLRMAHRAPGESMSGIVECVDLAMHRGVPFYRLGLKHLYDLVAMFAEADGIDPDVTERMTEYLTVLRPLMQAANQSEPFVSFRSLAYRTG